MIAPGASGTVGVRVYAGPQEQDKLKAVAPGPRSRRRLRLAHGDCRAAVLGAGMAARLARQLGPGDHRCSPCSSSSSSFRSRRRVTSRWRRMKLVTPRLTKTARAVRQRSREAEPGDDGAVQDGEDQPARRLPADRGADPGVHRALLGAARARRTASRALLRLDQGPLGAGSVLHPARDHDGLDDHPDQDEPDAARSGAGEGDDDHAVRVRRDVLLLSRRAWCSTGSSTMSCRSRSNGRSPA